MASIIIPASTVATVATATAPAATATATISMAAMAPARIMAAFSPYELLSAVPKFGEPFIVSKFPPRVTNVDPIPFILCHVSHANLRDAAGGCP